MSRKQVFVSLLAIPLLVFLVACGGDKKDSPSNNDGGGSDPSSSSNAGGGSTGNSGAGSVSSNDGALSLENCRQYTSLAAAAASASAPTSGAKLDKKAFEDMVKAAPSEIRSDVQVFADVMASYIGELEKLGVNLSDPSSFAGLDPAKLQQMQTVMGKLGDKKFTDASERIAKFYASKCS